jgi:hypothetical protein
MVHSVVARYQHIYSAHCACPQLILFELVPSQAQSFHCQNSLLMAARNLAQLPLPLAQGWTVPEEAFAQLNLLLLKQLLGAVVCWTTL